MHKKLMLACMAIAASAAFVIAPAASASPVLTNPGGGTTAVGTSITALNTGTTTFTGSNGIKVHCSAAHMFGTLTLNSGSQIKGEIPAHSAIFTGTGAGGDCTSGLGDTAITVNSKLCLETVAKTDEVKVTGCGGSITFMLSVTSGPLCAYEGNVNFGGSFTTNAPATLNVVDGRSTSFGGIPGESNNSFLCPGSGKLDMDFDLYNTEGRQFLVS